MSIAVNITGWEQFDIDADDVQEVVDTVAELGRGKWVQLAGDRLHTTAQDYINGVQPVQSEEFHAWVELVGELPNALEEGAPPYDLKPGLLQGPSARTSSGGRRYNVVPFRHGTPSQTRIGNPMPQDVYATMRRRAIGQRIESSRSGRKVLKRYRRQQSRTGHRHAAKLHAGLTKTGEPGHAAYLTFRTVSENSAPGAWMHPGFQPLNLIPEVEKYMEEQADALVSALLAD